MVCVTCTLSRVIAARSGSDARGATSSIRSQEAQFLSLDLVDEVGPRRCIWPKSEDQQFAAKNENTVYVDCMTYLLVICHTKGNGDLMKIDHPQRRRELASESAHSTCNNSCAQ